MKKKQADVRTSRPTELDHLLDFLSKTPEEAKRELCAEPGEIAAAKVAAREYVKRTGGKEKKEASGDVVH